MPLPPWPPLVPGPRRRRYPAWVVGSAVLTIVFLVAGVFASVLFRTPTPQGSADEYRFLARDFSGDPIRWNPCDPIHYVTNLADAPPGSIDDVTESVRRVSRWPPGSSSSTTARPTRNPASVVTPINPIGTATSGRPC